MKRLARLEKHGWKIGHYMSGRGCQATKNNGLTKITGTSITDLHRQIFGY